MSKTTVKRNSTDGMDQDSEQLISGQGGVGGRQEESPPGIGGGGYPDNCTALNFSAKKKRDPRLDELYTMGLHGMWLEVAESIGVDNFLSMWRLLDAHPSNYEDNGMKLIPLRRYNSYLRFQRNRYIEALSAAGFSVQEIREKLSKQLCETISHRHISRLAKKA